MVAQLNNAFFQKYLEGSGRGLFKVIFRFLHGGNHSQVANTAAEIRTQCLPHISPELYR
jgi:hypothetical protein